MNQIYRTGRIHFVVLAILLLTIKTYIIYKTAFQLSSDSVLQEFILILNPLGFLMAVMGIGVFFKGQKQIVFILAANLILSAILYANIVFFRFYNDFLTFPVLSQSSNMSNLRSSVRELTSIRDAACFIDCILLLLAAFFKPRPIRFGAFRAVHRKQYYALAAGVLMLNLALAESERPQLLTRTFDRKILVKNIGTYNFHLYDAILQSKSSTQRALADTSQLQNVNHYLHGRKRDSGSLFGAAKGCNVILISMESTQSFVMHTKMNGQEITPFLNKFSRDSYYFTNLYHQTGQGKTSDAEFVIENSLYPLGRGAVFFTNPRNEYDATPKILASRGYHTAVMHANNKSFWNRDIMYKSLGYDRFYHLMDYHATAGNSIGWGLKDKEFFDQSLPYLTNLPQPFYAKLITLTNHFPFELEEKDKSMNEFHSGDHIVNQYLQTVRYTDEAVGQFIQKLKEQGLYDRSLIILYGDHYGISSNHYAALGRILGRDITPFESVQLQRVPLMIHLPGQKGKVLDETAGQIDIKPTVLHLLGIDTLGGLQFGRDLFSGHRENYAILRSGDWITDDYLFTKDTCFSKKTGREEESDLCREFSARAGRELNDSDKIIYGDLLRFLKTK
ncbi:LTA synthase family protein [Peribacillus kribbensis]|uniref:LTA synthase family protein n=1 Tax=Peribacillus kribbensis TaxID=356658 RepID=UPI00042A1120|nr:LTA synthase family protein [Peribacillus kribbensis]